MNLKTNKDIIIRVVKNFAGVTAFGSMVLLIAMMFFAESIVFSKEVLGLLIGTAFLFTGIGGVVSATLIFFSICKKKIAKLEKIIADQNKTIESQNNQLQEARMYVKAYSTSMNPTPKSNANPTDNKIFKEIEPLSEEVQIDEFTEQEVVDDSNHEPTPPQDSPVTEDA